MSQRRRSSLIPLDRDFHDLDERDHCLERNLIRAVLIRAIADYHGKGSSARDARFWVDEQPIPGESSEQTEKRYLAQDFSFSWICQQLELDVTVVRLEIQLGKVSGLNNLRRYWVKSNNRVQYKASA